LDAEWVLIDSDHLGSGEDFQNLRREFAYVTPDQGRFKKNKKKTSRCLVFETFRITQSKGVLWQGPTEKNESFVQSSSADHQHQLLTGEKFVKKRWRKVVIANKPYQDHSSHLARRISTTCRFDQFFP